MKNIIQEDKHNMTNEEFMRVCSVDEIAGIIYEWHSAGYTKGRTGLKLDSITEVVEWLKQNHKK